MEDRARILVVSPSEDLIREVINEFNQYCVEGANQEEFEAIVAQNTGSWEIVILDFTLKGVSEDLLGKALALNSKPEVIVLHDLVKRREVGGWPINIWSLCNGAYFPVSIGCPLTDYFDLLRMQVSLALASHRLRLEREAKGPLLDDEEIFRLLQLMHICQGGDQALLDREIKVKWTESRPLAKIGDHFNDIEEIQGVITLGEEDAVDFPLRTHVPSLIVLQEDGVKAAIPYDAFLVKGVEICFELPPA